MVRPRGRPPLYDERMKKVNIVIRNTDAEFLRHIGNGNLSAGIRTMCERYNELRRRIAQFRMNDGDDLADYKYEHYVMTTDDELLSLNEFEAIKDALSFALIIEEFDERERLKDYIDRYEKMLNL